MKLNLKWRYPEETEIHEHTFYDIDPASVSIGYSMLHFHGFEEPEVKSWTIMLNHIVEMNMEEE